MTVFPYATTGDVIAQGQGRGFLQPIIDFSKINDFKSYILTYYIRNSCHHFDTVHCICAVMPGWQLHDSPSHAN